MRYGRFDGENREYVVERPDTPRPWSNYIGSAEFGAVLTNNAAGYSFYKSAAQGRLTRFRFNGPASDMPGKFVYLRDNSSGEIWSNSWMPCRKPLDKFKSRTRFGTGYAVIESEYAGIRCETTYFVPIGALHEVWAVKIENRSGKARKLSVFPFVEPQCNWNALDDATNLQYTQYISRTEFKDGIIDIGSNVNMPEDPDNFTNKDQKRHLFFAVAGARLSGFESELEKFIGAYGSYSEPEALLKGKCSNSLAWGGNPCGAFEIRLDMKPGQAKDFAVVFGVGTAKDEGRKARSRMEKPDAIEKALASIKTHWHSKISSLQAETPDPEFDSMANTWAPFNNLMTFYWSRTASMIYAGERDGLGFRDTVQDIVGASALVPDEARERLELMLTGQLANGGALPVVKPFAHRPGHEKEPAHYRSDDCLWFFNAVPQFVKETGDLGLFTKVLPFADKGSGTVFAHLRRAIEFNLGRSGAHGLPCGLHADWNDCLRLGEKGESVFVAFQLRLALKEYIEIADRLDESEEKAWAEKQLAVLDENIERHCWDGEWYLRGFRYDGLKFGSKDCSEGKIFVNPQSWAVISGHAVGKRAEKILKAVEHHLSSEHGVMLCAPPYVRTDPEVCLARLMNPGLKENGAIFNHVQGWFVMAEAMAGRNEEAWRHLKAVLPSSYNAQAEIRKVEPYAVCQSTNSRFSRTPGTGNVPWLSGSAVWNYFAITNVILGIRPHYDGLEINPCMPPEWNGFRARRKFRDCEFQIEVSRATAPGEKSLIINGKKLEGAIIPACQFEKNNKVKLAIYTPLSS